LIKSNLSLHAKDLDCAAEMLLLRIIENSKEKYESDRETGIKVSGVVGKKSPILIIKSRFVYALLFVGICKLI
jgi:hypothetical protein